MSGSQAPQQTHCVDLAMLTPLQTVDTMLELVRAVVRSLLTQQIVFSALLTGQHEGGHPHFVLSRYHCSFERTTWRWPPSFCPLRKTSKHKLLVQKPAQHSHGLWGRLADLEAEILPTWMACCPASPHHCLHQCSLLHAATKLCSSLLLSQQWHHGSCFKAGVGHVLACQGCSIKA